MPTTTCDFGGWIEEETLSLKMHCAFADCANRKPWTVPLVPDGHGCGGLTLAADTAKPMNCRECRNLGRIG